MSSLAGAVHAYPVGSFVALAFAITWIAFIPFYMAGGELIAWFTFGPFIAALICSMILGGWPQVKGLFASVVKWRVAPFWYLVAIGLPICAQLIGIFLNPVLGSQPANWTNVPALPQIIVATAILLVFSGPLGEEPGWRGFALPRLLADHPALNASVIIGAIWAAWHLPLALLGELSLYGSIHVFFAAVVFTWIWQNTESVLIAVLTHAAHQNAVQFLSRVYEDGDRIQQQWISSLVWLVVAIAIVAVHGSRSFKRA